jgi:Ca2+-binding RTX toxin-like protein
LDEGRRFAWKRGVRFAAPFHASGGSGSSQTERKSPTDRYASTGFPTWRGGLFNRNQKIQGEFANGLRHPLPMEGRGTGARIATVAAFVCSGALLLTPPAGARPHCNGRPVTISKHRGHIRGTAGPDVIVAGAGADRISAGGGRDLICSGGGADVVNGGNGRDHILAGAGDDTIIGGPGGEVAVGGSGSDRIFGGQQDDRLIGSSGDDLLVGDQGKDTMRGMTGNDWLRGDVGNNTYDGGPDSDTASFATELNILVVLTGAAGGSGGRSPMHDVENVVGTVGSDQIRGDGFPLAGSVRGLGWVAGQFQFGDHCTGFSQTDCDQSLTGGTPAVVADSTGPDPGVIVAGGPGADAIHVSSTSSGVRVSDSSPIVAGAGCTGSGTTTVNCTISGEPGHVAVFGMGGDDTLGAESNFGPATTVVFDGGSGADHLVGGPGNEILNGGQSDLSDLVPGAQPPPDELDAGGGDDSLLSGEIAPSIMHGGPGSDQLIAASACQGDLLDGGPGGSDIAGFAQIDRSLNGVIAQIGGEARDERHFGSCSASQVTASNEILEGTNESDVLIGSRGSDALIIGHGGDDLIKGLGGADGLRGDDGRDTLLGGSGADFLDARDGERDRRIDCGPGGFRASRDGRDPPARGCQR